MMLPTLLIRCPRCARPLSAVEYALARTVGCCSVCSGTEEHEARLGTREYVCPVGAHCPCNWLPDLMEATP